MYSTSGIITKSYSAQYEVICEDGSHIICKPRGNFLYKNLSPCVGDHVVLSFNKGDVACIESIKERKNSFLRPPISNVDIMIVVVAATSPQPNFYQLDCILSIAASKKVDVLLVITKCDLEKAGALVIEQRYKQSGYKVILSENTDSIRDVFLPFLRKCKNKTVVFCGNSGVGKTTLCNRIFPDLSLQIGAISEKTQRGRHTTRHVTLYSLSDLLGEKNQGGFLADTPGFGLVDFEKFDFFDLDLLPYTFLEFENYLGKCRYHDCTHTKEEGCAILKAIENDLISKERHQSFLQLYQILKNKKKRER